MDNNMLGAWLLMFIENHFPGGTTKFTAEGGVILEFNNESVIIYHPEMPVSFAEAVTENIKGIDIVLTSDTQTITEAVTKIQTLNESAPPPPVRAMEQERHSITEDDVTDLKIMMEQGIDAFIDNM